MLLKFDGDDASIHKIGLYDVAEAMKEFHRSLMITNHFFLTKKAIHNVSHGKNIEVLSTPPTKGSWSIEAIVMLFFNFDTPEKSIDSVTKIKVAWDIIKYVWNQTLNIQTTLKPSTMEYLESTYQETLEDVIYNCRNPIKAIHRPIVYSKTASQAIISSNVDDEAVTINKQTYKSFEEKVCPCESTEVLINRFNVETNRGRCREGRSSSSFPFQLSEKARKLENTEVIVRNLREHGVSLYNMETEDSVKLKFFGDRIIDKRNNTIFFKVHKIKELS